MFSFTTPFLCALAIQAAVDTVGPALRPNPGPRLQVVEQAAQVVVQLYKDRLSCLLRTSSISRTLTLIRVFLCTSSALRLRCRVWIYNLFL